MKADVHVIVQPWCGDAPCPEDDDPKAAALMVRRVLVNGEDIPFHNATLATKGNPGILVLTLEMTVTALKTSQVVDAWDPNLTE